jgi:hypothetical protein
VLGVPFAVPLAFTVALFDLIPHGRRDARRSFSEK